MTQRNRRTGARSLAKFSLTLVLATLIIGWGSWQYYLTSPNNSNEAVELNIPSGSSVRRVGQILHEADLIRSPHIFQLYVRLGNLSVQAGDYTIVPGPLPTIASALTSGRENEVRVTIPEGYRREQIAEVLLDKLAIPTADFLSLTTNLEGSLFPDTYSFAKDSTAEDVVKRLSDTFAQKTNDLDLTREDIILASIVEREALTPEEKPIVAGILKNRIRDGWALEVDATIQYIMGKSGDWWPTPLLGDRTRRSPYNTYQNQGLPPTAIGNPGLVSLSAVKNPQATPYYFYLHDRTGRIHYATTNAEHEANIARYIR